VSTDEEMVVDFDATNSFDINNDELTFTWDFGDGSQGTGAIVSHAYKRIDNYDVKLIVKDNTDLGCSTGIDFAILKLNRAPSADAGEDIVVCSGENILFDGSKSFAHKKGTLDAKWFFGDGTSKEGLTVSHTYGKPGKYLASLTVDNQLNKMCPSSRDTREVIINNPPGVELIVKEAACTGKEVHFDASGTSDDDGDSLEFYWTFGDGTILTAGPKVTHTYKQGGTYRASVIVDDGKGSDCSTATAHATLNVNTPPIADAGPNLTCCAMQESLFDASTSSDPDGNTIMPRPALIKSP